MIRHIAPILLAMAVSGVLSAENATPSPAPIQQSEADLLAGIQRAICYSGFRKGQHPDRGDGAINPSEEEILEDLKILSETCGFKLIRLYDSQVNSETVLRLIRTNNLNIKVLLGAWLDAEVNNPGCPWQKEPYSEKKLGANLIANRQEVDRAIRLANNYRNIIVSVAVGNEALVDWNDHMVPVESVISYVEQVKQAIEQPVTVADNYEWWAKHGSRLAEKVDFVSIHIYPIWEHKDIKDAMAYSIANVQAVRSALPDSRIVITEAGWATTASEFGERASESKQAAYFDDLFSWTKAMNITTFFFEAFDEDWKGDPSNPLGAEKHWGLYFIDRKPKEVMSR